MHCVIPHARIGREVGWWQASSGSCCGSVGSPVPCWTCFTSKCVRSNVHACVDQEIVGLKVEVGGVHEAHVEPPTSILGSRIVQFRTVLMHRHPDRQFVIHRVG